MDRTTPRTPCHAQPPRPLPLADAFREHLSNDDLDHAIAAEGIRFRDRLFTPTVTFWTFFAQVFHAGASCRQALIRLLAARLPTASGEAPAFHTGTYCKARQRLSESLLTRPARLVADRVEAAASHGNWNGHAVKLVDGTTVSMPDSPANRTAFPPHKSQKPGVGFPLARLVAILGLASGCLLRTALAPWSGKGKGEGSLLAGMPDEFRPQDLLVGDACYSSYWLLASLVTRQAHYVGDLSSTRPADYRRGRCLGPTDRVVTWSKPSTRSPGLSQEAWDALPATFEVRRFRVAVDRPGFRTKVRHLLTTLLDAKRYRKADLAVLYRRRWQVELHFRALKIDMELGVLRCKSPAMIRKELALHAVVYNAVRAVMGHAGVRVKREAYRLSFTAAREAIGAFAPPLSDPVQRERALAAMLELIGSQEVDERPNRVEPRVLKRRPKDCKYMTKPRDQYPRVTKTSA